MKHINILVILTTLSISNPYQQIQDALIENQNTLMAQLNSDMSYYLSETQRSIDKILVRGQNMQSGAMATSSIDFGYHQGHSIGFGLGTGNTWDDYRAVAVAFGYQYKVDEVSFATKFWIGDENIYGIGIGMVIEL